MPRKKIGEKLGDIYLVPVGKVRIKKGHNHRNEPSKKPSKGLIKSIEVEGVVNPVHVRTIDNELYLIDGERRLHACHAAEVDELPVINHGVISDLDAIKMSITLNLNHRKLTPEERYNGVVQLHGEGMTAKDIAPVVDIGVKMVREIIKTHKFGSKVLKEAVKSGKVTPRAAAEVASLPKKIQNDVVYGSKKKSERQVKKAVAKRKNVLGAVIKARKKNGGTKKEDLSLPFKMTKDAADLCKYLQQQAYLRYEKTSPSSKPSSRWKVILDVMEVLRGTKDVESLF